MMKYPKRSNIPFLRLARRPAWFAAPVAAGLTLALLLGVVTLGISISSLGPAGRLPGGGRLDYGRGSITGFSPLRDAFIQSVLGELIPFTARPPGSAPSPRGVADASDNRTVDSHGLTNDDLRDARIISGIPYTARTITTEASRQSADPSDCAQTGGTVWYRYTPERDLGLIAYTFGTDHAAALGVFRGSPGNMQQIRCDTDASGNALVAFPAKAGQIYYFQVTAPLGGGRLVFSLDPHGTISRVSVSSAGEQANGASDGSVSMSDDGRYIAFTSFATNLAPGADTAQCLVNDPREATAPGEVCALIYVHDLNHRTTELISLSSAGVPANSRTANPFISSSGRYVVYESGASNLVENDPNGQSWDVFWHDRLTRRTERIPANSPLIVEQRRIDHTEWFLPTVSADGRYVAFQSIAPLVGDDTNGVADAFVYDRVSQRHERVSVSSSGGETEPTVDDLISHRPAPLISADGRYVEFRSLSSRLVPNDRNNVRDTFLRDRLTGTTERISVSSEGVEGDDESGWAFVQLKRISPDGRQVVFRSLSENLVPGDTNDAMDTFIRDRVTGRTTRVSVSSTGEQARSSASRDPRSMDMNASISTDGRFVAFETNAGNLAGGDDNADVDIYLRDLLSGTTTLVTLSPRGESSTGGRSGEPSVSLHGRFIAFYSEASNLVDGDTNGLPDVFVYEAPRLR